MSGKVVELKQGPRSHNCQFSILLNSTFLLSSWVATSIRARIKPIFAYMSTAKPYILLEFRMNKTAIYWKFKFIVIFLDNKPAIKDKKTANLMWTKDMMVKNNFVFFNTKNNVSELVSELFYYVVLKCTSDLLPVLKRVFHLDRKYRRLYLIQSNLRTNFMHC